MTPDQRTFQRDDDGSVPEISTIINGMEGDAGFSYNMNRNRLHGRCCVSQPQKKSAVKKLLKYSLKVFFLFVYPRVLFTLHPLCAIFLSLLVLTTTTTTRTTANKNTTAAALGTW